ncbi:MAG: DUF4416 family protein [Aquificaceae bacterium]
MELSKPIIALLYREEELLEDFLSEISYELTSESFYFEGLQRYYRKEMGKGLYKRFVSLKGLMKKEDLLDFKLWAMKREEAYKLEGRRRLNIDVGYVDESHLILASSKKRGGRIYLGSGVYAEMEYLYVYGAFRPLYWTYGDYRDKRVRDFFEGVRERFLEELNLTRKGHKPWLIDFSKDKLY